MDSAIVSSVLALGEQTVLLDSGSGVRHFLRVFIRDALAAFVILLAIFGGPPVTQVAVRVEFASLIVEAMNDFMSDDHANGAEINRIVFRRIEIRRLQNTGGKVDGVELRIIVGVDRRRSHGPLSAIYGFANLRHPALELKGRGVRDVVQITRARDVHIRVITPIRGISDFVFDSLQLRDGLFLGGG